MPARRIAQGQHVTEAKTDLARRLRREMTAAERRLWAALRRNQLDGFHVRRQQIIDGFVADFYCHAAGLVIEVDGPIHQANADYDAERDRVISARNLRVLRVTNEDIARDLPAVLSRISALCRSLATTHSTEPTADDPDRDAQPRHPLPCEGRGPGG
jgi:very-short-patch-repair endonuclease